jgi:ribosomal protein S12 methylthiotransferase accessory factor
MREAPRFNASVLAARASIAAIGRTVGNGSGIIESVSVEASNEGEPRVFHAEARLNEKGHGRPMLCDDVGFTTGAGLDPELAVSCALGEALERYCYAVHDASDVVVATYDELTRSSVNAVAPAAFALYSPAQFALSGFPYHPFTNDLPVSWTCGFSLTTGKETWVPDLMVHAPSRVEPRGDLIVAPSMTTGLCCAPTIEAAVLGGICEVVERDAAMCMWANRLPCTPVRPTVGSWLADTIADCFSCCRAGLSLYIVPSDIGIPTVLATLIDPMDDGAAASVGTAAGIVFDSAAVKAAVEAAQVRRWLKRAAVNRRAQQTRSDYSAVRGFADHVALFGKPENLRHLEFIAGRRPVERSTPDGESTDVTHQLRQALRALHDRNLETIVVDITRPDVAALGFSVVRTLVPGLIDINADHAHRLLGGSRLLLARQRGGCDRHASAEADLNDVPHPFP